jgi:hypothetical protein
MYYSDAQTYLNEEFRKPIKYYLKGVSQKKQKQVMEVVDYLCDKYREINGTANFYEAKLKASTDHNASDSLDDFFEWRLFMDKNGYLEPIDYDAVNPIYSDEEVENMLSEE